MLTTFQDLAHQIVTHGTWASRPALEAMAALAYPIAPGASAALVDWSGSEVARYRAFSVVASCLSRSLTRWEVAELVAGAAGSQAA